MPPGDAAAVGAPHEAPPHPQNLDVAVPHVAPGQLVGDFTNLIQELDEALELMNEDGPMSPQLSCCTSLGSWNIEITVSQSSEGYCTCDFKDVDSGQMSNDDVLILCCGMFRSPSEACICTTS